MEKTNLQQLTDGYDAEVIAILKADIEKFNKTGKLPNDYSANARTVTTKAPWTYWDWVENNLTRGQEGISEPINNSDFVDPKTKDGSSVTRKHEAFFEWLHGGGPEEMPEIERVVFERHFVAGLTQSSVAEELGVSQQYVGKVARRVRTTIAEVVGIKWL